MKIEFRVFPKIHFLVEFEHGGTFKDFSQVFFRLLFLCKQV